jgi:hypothetical protein
MTGQFPDAPRHPYAVIELQMPLLTEIADEPSEDELTC